MKNHRESRQQAAELILHLKSLGVELWIDDGRLRYRAPQGVFSAELKERIRNNLPVIIKILEEDRKGDLIYEDTDLSGNSPFPLTDVQSSYLLGKTEAVLWGGIGCHGYVEVNFGAKTPADIDRTWNILVERYGMLRASVEAEGIRIVDVIPGMLAMESTDVRGLQPKDQQAELDRIRTELCRIEYDLAKPPLFRTQVTLREAGTFFHLSIDLIIADFASVQLLIGEMGVLLNDEKLPQIDIDFKSYALAVKNLQGGLNWQEDKQYWLNRIDSMPPAPVLPRDGRAAPLDVEGKGKPKFRRLQKRLDGQKWSSIRSFAGQHGLTSSAVVLTAYQCRTMGKKDTCYKPAVQGLS